ncbi:flavin reductase (DIM6/NTAB) family NADH-FMN oxidoreductase RutF [Sinobacterium caligoides]|uniref:Flavin reductase (DIM6/NTAB) family NADH-FMN oxidoreductase RutF n=1 Tax=Sinobacterium caligoides TaxID=933926 RepID=A0A3N2DXX2_9GAMM|nr:flavin reductase family protein [Sinobacterium caligoides]ROS04644.1 flavin reductase (DIM6/NTAB) family NADH-FMN oxidoreductase RutF [Sinobacterium caligoides]
MSFDSREFRNALGRFPTGVCVITTTPEGGKPMGMTVNSFAALSLEPALVLWSIQTNSECYAVFEKAKGFTVNVLSEEQVDVSNAYAKKGDHDLKEGEFRLGKSGQPVLKGAITSFECTMSAQHDGGDHVIIVGEVIEMDNSPTGRPLVFHSGKYEQLR